MNPSCRVESATPDEHGFSLIEAMLAALLLVIAIVAIVQLFAIAASSNVIARSRTVATILAWQKLEQLRAIAAHSDLVGGGSLIQDTSGFVDHVDANGIVLGAEVQRPPGRVYTRRWSIGPVLASADGVWLIEVCVVGQGTLAQLITITGSLSR